MTRIGTVTVKLGGKYYTPAVLQYVKEDGEGWTLAKFQYDQPLVKGGFDMSPGAINRVTHLRYRRAA